MISCYIMKFGIKLLLIFLFSFLMIDIGLNLLIPHGQNGVFELTNGFGAAALGVFLIIKKIARIGYGLKQVSSELTAGIRFILPLMLLAFGISIISDIIEFFAKRDYQSIIAGLIIIGIVYTLLHLLFKYSSKVMEVRYSGDEVVISNFKRREKVAIDQIDHVDRVFLFLQCVTFKRDTAFGCKVYFLSSIYETLAFVGREPILLKDFKRQIYMSRKDGDWN